MKKVLVPLAGGFEEIEAVGIIDICRRAGLDVTIAGFEDFAIGAHNVTFDVDAPIDDLQAADFDAIAIPGGMNQMLAMNSSAKILAVIRELFSAGKLVSAICASPVVLSTAGVLDGKRATCYPALQERLTSKCVVSPEARVEVDGNVITSQGPGTTHEFALAIVSYLLGNSAATQVKEDMLIK